MKDFIFSDPSETTVTVIYRTDLIGNSNANFNIMRIIGLDDVRPYQNKKRAILASWRHRGTYANKGDFMTFAQAQGLNLVMQDSNGDNATTLVAYLSDFGASSW